MELENSEEVTQDSPKSLNEIFQNMSLSYYSIAEELSQTDSEHNHTLSKHFRNLGDDCSDVVNSAIWLGNELHELSNDMQEKISNIEQIKIPDNNITEPKSFSLWRYIIGKHE